MKKFIVSLSVLSSLASPLAKAECIAVQMPTYTETRCQLSDLHDSDQVEAVNEFIDNIRGQIDQSHMPKKGSAAAQKSLDAVQENIRPFIDSMISTAQRYRRGRGIGGADLAPNGFFFVVGGNFSAGAGLSGGGTALAAFAAVPTFVKRIDNFTKAETHRYEWDMSPGGVIQGGIGAGAGTGGGARAGIGLIFGDIPKAADIFEAGFSLGGDGDAALIAGFGLSAIFPRNKTTGLHNLVLFAHGDTGANAKIEVHGCAFEFIDESSFEKIPYIGKWFSPS